RLGWIVRFVADVLNGTPSIVIGIFAWTWLVKPMGHFSALAGSVALAALMIPMIARTTEEMVRLVPHSLREAALALGYARWRTSLRIDAGQGGSRDDAERGAPAGVAERQRRLAKRVRHESHHLFGGARDHRDHERGERHAS